MKYILLFGALVLTGCSESLLERKLDLVDSTVTDTELRRVHMDARESKPELGEHLDWVYQGRDLEHFTGFRGTLRDLILKEASLVAEEAESVLPDMIEKQERFERRSEGLEQASLVLTNMKLPSSRSIFGAWEGSYKFTHDLGLPVSSVRYMLSLSDGEKVIARHQGSGENINFDPVVSSGESQQGKYKMSTFGFDNNGFVSKRVKNADQSNLTFSAKLLDACNIENACLMYGLRDRRDDIAQLKKELTEATEIINQYRK